MSLAVQLKPHVSEKSYAASEKGVYVFDVPLTANKHTVKLAVENQYKVTVDNVRTVVTKGKPKRLVAKRRQPSIGHRRDVKKAYVTLKKGDRINIFAEESA